MKQIKLMLLLAGMLLTGSIAVAQNYMNVATPWQHGSIPLAKLDSMLFDRSDASTSTFYMNFFTDKGLARFGVTDIDSLTFTAEPAFPKPDTSSGEVWLQLTGEYGSVIRQKMIPVWGYEGLYHALFYLNGTSAEVAYSFDQQNWNMINNNNNYSGYIVGEGWYEIILDYNGYGYLHPVNPFSVYTNRSQLAKQGFAYVIGSATGNWTDQNSSWRLSMPVEDNGWWASPRFVADGELRAYVKVPGYDWWNSEFTIHDGHIYWRDSDIPMSWAESKGADYSVQVKAGQKLYVNFNTGEALVSTPDEVTFPLENPVFLSSNTIVGGTSESTSCCVTGDNGNTVVLRWTAVDGASGYRIKMAYQHNVAGGGSTVWDNPDNLLMDTTVGADVTELTIPDLNYATNYRFAIQALSPRGEKYNSAWFGYGSGRYWYAYLALETAKRYATPAVVSVRDITKNSFRVYLNRDVSGASEEDLASYRQHFNFTDDAKTQIRVDYLTIEADVATPNAVVPEKFKRYTLTADDLAKGYVDVDGLSESSVYDITAYDATIASKADASFNTVQRATRGTPGAPILLSHDNLMATSASSLVNDWYQRDVVYELAADYQAAPISPTLDDFMTNVRLAEGQVFYLEGGKTYYLDGQTCIYKGLTLATNPKDVARGRRARVICGIGKNSDLYMQSVNGEQWNGGPYSLFMLGRQQETGEEGTTLEISTIAFRDIDFDNPKAFNYGDNVAGVGTTTGNYFMNMYSDGIGMTLDSLVIENCTFKRLVRGFIREQGVNAKVWNHTLIKNNQFFDCGYYNQGAGGYGMIAGGGRCEESNLYKDMRITDNTFYDSPFPSIFFERSVIDWTAGPWNITFSNNTLVNFNTRANGAIFQMRGLPDGSVFNVKNNLIIICKQNGDQRVLQMFGADIRNTQQLADGSYGKVTLNFENNWSTNNDLTNGQIFSANAWTATANSFGTLVANGYATLNGTLEIQAANISATDLMISPCPPHKASSSAEQNMHRADALDGSATTEYNVNLYFKNTDNDIYRNNVGAPVWSGRTR